ncbi:MAG: VWA domain-containing protein [Halobacteriales archaeon]
MALPPDTLRSRRACIRAGALALGSVLAGCSSTTGPGSGPDTDDRDTDENSPDDDTPSPTPTGERVDDWQYDPTTPTNGGTNTQTAAAMATAQAGGGSIGLAAGGAKGVANYRRNIEEGYLPIPSDLSYEGLFYDYYFDTGDPGSCSALFCPAYSTAITADPLGGEVERYLTVGLNSGLATSDFERKTLNLVVVLDISGSMDSAFSEYYYDRFGNRQEREGDGDRPKIDVAAESIAALTTHLRPDDRFGVVLFNDESHLAKPMRTVGETDMAAIREHLRELTADGGTNLSAGIEEATGMLEEYADADRTAYETRMVTMTDAMPNIGELSEGGLQGRLQSNAEQGIYTTFLGVGVDFNTELIDAITAIEGSNYYSVHSEEGFRERLDQGFEYMVTPLAFDVSLEVDAGGYDIETVYGSTAAGEATGEITYVNTLFPSPKHEGKAKGGIVLVKLARTGESPDLSLRASWEDRTGEAMETTTDIAFPDRDPEYFANTGIRKGILLARYADLMKNWMVYERTEATGDGATESGATESATPDGGDGIEEPPGEDELGEWERQSTTLTVSSRYRERFEAFIPHFESEMDALGDDTLAQELEILRTLAEYEG